MRALCEIGLGKALRFAWCTVELTALSLLGVPQLRSPFLRLLGTHIVPDANPHGTRFFPVYRLGFLGPEHRPLRLIGDDCRLDLAGRITSTPRWPNASPC